MLGAILGAKGLGALGAVAQAPLTKAALRYWWVTLPLGYLAWHSYRKRKAAGTLDAANLINDLAPAATLAMSLVLLDVTLRSHQAATPAAPAAPVSGLGGAAQPRRPAPPPIIDTEAEIVQAAPAGARNGLV